MYFRSRDRYRHAIEEIAEPTGDAQIRVALKSIERARQVAERTPGARQAHVGYYRVGAGRHFVIEGDEYDSAFFDKTAKFLKYLPDIAVVGNIEFDHADIYKDLDAVKLAFRRFMNLAPSNGRLIAGWDSPNVRAVVESFGSRLFTTVETFGTTGEAKWQIRNADFSGGLSKFEVVREGRNWGDFATPLLGEFNLLNCLAVIIAADAWGVSRERIKDALASFKNVKRRAEVRGERKRHWGNEDIPQSDGVTGAPSRFAHVPDSDDSSRSSW